MPDVKEVAENEIVEPENDTESPAVENFEESEEQEVSEEAEDTNEEQVTEERAPTEPATRAERRIRDLVEKQKAIIGENQRLKQDLFQPSQTLESIVRPGESEIDPLELQKRIDAYVDNKVTQTLNQKSTVDNYMRTYEEHVTDLERVIDTYPELDEQSDKYDPVLGKKFEQLYNKLNDVQEGGRGFVPKTKASEVASLILDIRDKSALKKAADLSVKRHEQLDSAAVQPNSTSETRDDSGYKLQQAFDKARSTESAKDWATYYKLYRNSN